MTWCFFQLKNCFLSCQRKQKLVDHTHESWTIENYIFRISLSRRLRKNNFQKSITFGLGATVTFLQKNEVFQIFDSSSFFEILTTKKGFFLNILYIFGFSVKNWIRWCMKIKKIKTAELLPFPNLTRCLYAA